MLTYGVKSFARLEEEDKLLNAESYYKKALSIDETFQEAEDALLKLRKQIQVILYFLLADTVFSFFLGITVSHQLWGILLHL